MKVRATRTGVYLGRYIDSGVVFDVDPKLYAGLDNVGNLGWMERVQEDPAPAPVEVPQAPQAPETPPADIPPSPSDPVEPPVVEAPPVDPAVAAPVNVDPAPPEVAPDGAAQ